MYWLKLSHCRGAHDGHVAAVRERFAQEQVRTVIMLQDNKYFDLINLILCVTTVTLLRYESALPKNRCDS